MASIPPPPEFSIRSFDEQDADAVIDLWRRCDLVRPWNDPKKDIARKLQCQPELFLVATVAEVIVGSAMAGYDGHRGWVYYVAADPAHRREGIGRALMEAAEQRLRALGCPKMMLMVRPDNTSVVDFYARLGFAPDVPMLLSKRFEAN